MFFADKEIQKDLLLRKNGQVLLEMYDEACFKLFKLSITFETQIHKILAASQVKDETLISQLKEIIYAYWDFLNLQQNKMKIMLCKVTENTLEKDGFEHIIYKAWNKLLEFYKKALIHLYEKTNYRLSNYNAKSLHKYDEFSQMHEFQKKIMYDIDVNPYQILGVEKNATKLQIKKAYLNLSKKYHPDFNKSIYAQEMIFVINNAYEQLKDL